MAHVLGPAAPVGLVFEAEALFDHDGWPPEGDFAAGEGWFVPQPPWAILGTILVQACAAVNGEVVKIRAGVDDPARPDQSVGIRIGDGATLVPGDGGLDVCVLRGEPAVLENVAQVLKTLLDRALLDRGEGGSEVS